MLQSQALRVLAKRWLLPSTRDRVRRGMARARGIAEASKVWNWQISRARDDHFDVLYAGRARERWRAAALFPGHEQAQLVGTSALVATRKPMVLLTELRLHGAFLVPCELTSLLDLKRPLSAILAGFDTELRRRIRRLSEQGYRLSEASYDQVEQLHNELFVPFALARHGEHAKSHTLEELLRFREFGRIDVLWRGDEVWGAQIGYPYWRSGTRRWVTDRFGYPERVFSNPKHLADANTMNIHLACECALAADYDYYDLGIAPALPDGGLLQFKRRRSSLIETSEQTLFMYAHIPFAYRPKVLARAPLFSIERRGIVLHVGVTEDMSDDALFERFHEWGYGGVAAVRLWAERAIAPAVLEHLYTVYRSKGCSTAISTEYADPLASHRPQREAC